MAFFYAPFLIKCYIESIPFQRVGALPAAIHLKNGGKMQYSTFLVNLFSLTTPYGQ